MVEERTWPLSRSNMLQRGTHFLQSPGMLSGGPKDTCKASIYKEPKYINRSSVSMVLKLNGGVIRRKTILKISIEGGQ